MGLNYLDLYIAMKFKISVDFSKCLKIQAEKKLLQKKYFLQFREQKLVQLNDSEEDH